MYILLFTQAPIPVCLDGTIIDSSTIVVTMYLKKNLNAPRPPSEHPPVWGKKCLILWLCWGMIGAWLCMVIDISVQYIAVGFSPTLYC